MLAIVGYLGPWVPHKTAALTVTGLELAEFAKFFPQVQAAVGGIDANQLSANAVIPSTASVTVNSGAQISYGSGATAVTALDHVNINIKEGEFVAVMGPSGCGKSTLLNMIGALDRPSAGKVIVNGQDVGTLRDLDELPLPTIARVNEELQEAQRNAETLTNLASAHLLKGDLKSAEAAYSAASELIWTLNSSTASTCGS